MWAGHGPLRAVHLDGDRLLLPRTVVAVELLDLRHLDRVRVERTVDVGEVQLDARSNSVGWSDVDVLNAAIVHLTIVRDELAVRR